MTPALLNLARRYMALPGFIWRTGMLAIPDDGENYAGWCRILRAADDGHVTSWTDEDGEILTDDDGPFETYARLVPCLTDDATGGVMLARLPGRPAVLMRGDMVHIEAEGASGFLVDGQSGATLAEAVARVAVALGRAG